MIITHDANITAVLLVLILQNVFNSLEESHNATWDHTFIQRDNGISVKHLYII